MYGHKLASMLTLMALVFTMATFSLKSEETEVEVGVRALAVGKGNQNSPNTVWDGGKLLGAVEYDESKKKKRITSFIYCANHLFVVLGGWPIHVQVS